MTTENSVSFKVFLTREEAPNQPEVRRFGIDRDVVSNFNYLREKLQTVFPSLHGKNFAVQWKDAEGDDIIITTDEELIIALTEMQTDVRKLYVILKPHSEPQQPKPHSEPQQPTGGSSYPVHLGVTCDGCGKTIEGFRYKCVQCPDYDLCSICENGNLHKEHFMIRVPVPISWRPYFGRRLAHHLSKSARRGGMPCENRVGEPQEACPSGAGSSCPYTPRGNHGCHRGRRGHHQGLGGHNWLETLSSYLSEWSNLPGEADPQNNPGNATTETTEPQQEQQQHINFLTTVGQTVANLLDPLGIDVDIEVRSKNGTCEKVTKSNETNQDQKEKESSPTPKNVTFADNVHETVVKEVVSKVNDMTLSDNTSEESNRGAIPKAASTSSVANKQTSPEPEGWTVVNGMETQDSSTSIPAAAPTGPVPVESSFYEAAHRAAMLGAQQAMAAQQTNVLGAHQGVHDAAHRAAHERAMAEAQHARELAHRAAYERSMWEAQQRMAASGNNNSIYPIMAHQAPQEPASQQIPHPQRHIDEAVQQMMSMGFTNEGGWLTQLIETQNGDIAKVFDILQPVKK